MQPESITRVLWRQARQGDAAAYEQLFSHHVDRLLMFIRARLGTGLRGRIEPEDVLQDTYLAAHRGFAEFEYNEDGAFLRWLCRIVENRIRDWNDHFSAGKRQSIEVPRSAVTGPVTALARAELCQRMEQALKLLPEDQRMVLLLRYFEGMTAEEAGVQLNRTSGAVRKLTARALVELGRHL